MNIYVPSWGGDFRFEPEGDLTKLTVFKPTKLEKKWIRRWASKAQEKDWITEDDEEKLASGLDEEVTDGIHYFSVKAPLNEAAALLIPIMGYKRVGVVTAIAHKDGKVELTEVLNQGHDEKLKEAVESGSGKAAATLKRPTLSCPECSGRPEVARAACDVLWEFLDPRQKSEWVKHRRLTVFGNLTGHAYSLAPRDSEQARKVGRIAFDMDDRVILHHYDMTVPPEEELLASKLLLEHRENWLRVPGEVDPASRASPGTIFPHSIPTGDFYSLPLEEYFARALGVDERSQIIASLRASTPNAIRGDIERLIAQVTSGNMTIAQPGPY